ncbi:electron transfer flavoprotein subunit beta/FixA family protein [Candidatus Hydrogenedentota bacterium]
MKIAVLIKRVPDTSAVLAIGEDGVSVVTGKVKHVMNPYDECAVEEAIKLKEANGAEVVIVSAGPPETKETIRTALAMGADSGLLVADDGLDGISSKGLSQVLVAALKTLSPDIIFAGKQAVDDDAMQVPERVAELLGWSHASEITSFECNDNTVTVDRDVEGGLFTLEVPLPAVLTAAKGLNTPRYPTLPNIMKAKRREIKEVGLSDLGIAPEGLVSGIEVKSRSLARQERLLNVLEGDDDERVHGLVKALGEVEKVL